MSQLWFRQAVAETAELRQQTPGQHLASLSLHFADHPDHDTALNYFCVSTDEYHQKHGMTIGQACSYAFTGTLFEYDCGGAA